MSGIIGTLETLMSTNIRQIQDSFSQVHAYGIHKSNRDAEITHSFKSEFEKMGIAGSLSKYISQEVPAFDPKWVTVEYTLQSHS